MGTTRSTDHWDSDRFRSIDDSLSTLLRQMVRATSALLLASLIGLGVLDHLLVHDGLGPADYAIGSLLLAVTCGSALFVASAVPIRRAITEQRLVIRSHETALSARVRRQEFSADVHDALEMAEDEAGALDITARAMGEAWQGPAELLLADSSRAHLRRVAVSSAAESSACGVASPWSCPAIRRGQTLTFASSESMAACPQLRDRPGGVCSAACVPVVVLGRPVGVIHTVGTVAEPASADAVAQLETTAGLVGSRLGVLRAMLQSQLQSSTDPLTGQLNRRSLEDRVRRLREDGVEHTVVFADLDHFKELNDTFGHETGDRALRLFARVLHESTRLDDLVCRYGGEEFLLVLPNTTVDGAAALLGQIQERLASATGSGRVPPFTASFGLAHSSWSEESAEVVAAADRAMFEAKRTGRNRLVIGERAGPADAVTTTGEGEPSPQALDLKIVS